jgi:hypothetical protein
MVLVTTAQSSYLGPAQLWISQQESQLHLRTVLNLQIFIGYRVPQ